MRPSFLLATLIFPLLVSLQSFGASPSLAIYLSVFKPHENTFWAQKTCQKIYEFIRNSSLPDTEVHCDWNQDETFLSEKIRLARRANTFQYMLDLKETNTEYRLRWVNWNAMDDVDFTQAGWTLKKQASTDLSLKKLINNLLEQHTYRIGLRRHFVSQVLHSKNLTSDHPLSEGEIASFIAENSKNKLYLKTVLEAVTTFGLAVSDNIKNKESAKIVWDLDSTATLLGEKTNLKSPLNWKSLNSKFEVLLQCQPHAHQSSISSLDTLLCSNIASFAWEMILEYHQTLRLSRDNYNLTIGSLAFEAMTYFQQVMIQPENSKIKKNLDEIFKSPQELTPLFPLKSLNYESLYKISSKEFVGKNNSVEIPILITPQGPKKLITSLNFDNDFRQNIMLEPYRDFTSTTQIALAGYYEKKQLRKEAQPLAGYNFFIGAKKAIDNRTSFNLSENSKNSDFIGAVHVFGSTLRLVTYSRGWRISAVLDVYADFASVRSYAIDRAYEYEGDPLAIAPKLKDKNSYYAVGATNLAQIVLEYGKWSIDLSAQNQRLSNLNAYKPEPYVSSSRNDRFTGLEIGTQYRLRSNLFLRLAVNETQRSGSIEDIGTKNNTTHTLVAKLIYRF